MADEKISALTELAATPANDDLFVIVDVSDVTQAPSGTTKNIQASNARAGLALSGAITASGLTMATARLLGRTTGGSGAPEEITVGAGLSLAAGALTATGSGKLIQTVNGSVTTGFSTATPIPLDDTEPQSGEGVEIATVTITPTSTSNFLKFTVSYWVTSASAGTSAAALFKDADASATRSALGTTFSAGGAGMVAATWLVPVASATSQTWDLRGGPTTAITLYINRLSSGSIFGSTDYITFIVEEIEL